MSMSAKELLDEARSRRKTVSPEDASSNAAGLILDVRELGELASAGSPDGAVHIPRGLLEFKADLGPATPRSWSRQSLRRSATTAHPRSPPWD